MDVRLQPWHALTVDADEYFYVKVIAAPAPDPESDAPAFELIVTDLLGVWSMSVRHDSAAAWAREKFPNVEEEYPKLFGLVRDRLLGDDPRYPPTVAWEPIHNPAEAHSLFVTAQLNERRSCEIECAPLPPNKSALLLRDQMIVPALHIGAILREHSAVSSWSAEQARLEAEEKLSSGVRFEFGDKAIAAMYSVAMRDRFTTESAGVVAPASPEALARIEGAPACAADAAGQPRASGADALRPHSGPRLKRPKPEQKSALFR